MVSKDPEVSVFDELVSVFDHLKEINDIKRGQITDVPSNHQYFSEIYTLCRAGVFSGSPDGSFQPDAQITRAQIAIVADCLLNPEMRVKQ